MGKKERKATLEAQQAQQQARADAVLALIEEAFDGIPAPDANHRTLHQAQAWDSYEKADQRKDHRGRWQDLPEAHLERCGNALYHLDEQGIPYYLPAIMSHFIRAPRKRWLIHEVLLWTLRPSEGELKAYQRQRFSRLSTPQRAAILAFLELAGASEPDLEPWRRVVEAGDAEDWFRRFY